MCVSDVTREWVRKSIDDALAGLLVSGSVSDEWFGYEVNVPKDLPAEKAYHLGEKFTSIQTGNFVDGKQFVIQVKFV